MKHIFKCLLGIIFFTSSLHAYLDLNGQSTDRAEDFISDPAEDRGPFTFEVEYNAFGRTKFDKSGYRNQHFTYSEASIEGSMVFHYDKCYKEGLTFTVGYDSVNLDWHQNPYFDDNNFHTITFALGGFSKRACDWLWIGSMGMNISLDHFNVDEYSTYDFLLWGRYDYMSCPDIGIHVGIIAQTGMKVDRVYPILGFDWKFNNNWKLNAVFPINMSAVYTYDDNWSFIIAARAIDSRHRVGKHEPLPRAIWEYRALGGEVGVDYERAEWLKLNLHAGILLGGNLKITNKHHKSSKRFDVECGAPYAGGEVTVNF